MKFISALILTALLGFATGLYGVLPWWSFAVTSFIVALAIQLRPWKSFLAAFVGLFLLWGVIAFIKDDANLHILSTSVAGTLNLGTSCMAVLLITALIGGLVAGIAALAGSYCRPRVQTEP